ncbi:PDZ domain-containing protein [Vagococcus coleopterorum]|uniref:PDZ domain-containing protein n=1 Tax=Vagococcus coleopterorum TaxID=2714946 RepID=A0A6G8ALF9_9ENTE|nr:trypsin-like peptidase domain-containing protein [Vagococcus coleopterorum]QIL45765.1 PDZ domain-containing protein [Vagococcus coleopterorum]
MTEIKDVTPNKKKNKNSTSLKRLLVGILGGVIGTALTLGLGYGFLKPVLTDRNPSVPNTAKTDVKKRDYTVIGDVSKAVETVQDAVVSVVNLQKKEQLNDFGRFFGEDLVDPNDKDDDALQANSEGSGVIYRKDGGDAYVVTNNHVVEGSDALEVLLNDGTKVPGELVGHDSYTDLAVIKIASKDVKATAEFGDSDSLKVGEPAIAIGSPLGSVYANSATQGIISAKNREITNQTEKGEPVSINALQTDAAINPGNSGGPLINIAGQVIGINSIKISAASSGVSAEGMGFSIPSNDVVAIISQLEKDGKVSRPTLGITMSDLSLITKDSQENILKVPADITTGVIIRSVGAATPAEKAGLQQYDVIVEIDGDAIETGTDLQSLLYKKKVGDKISVTFYREAEKKTTTVDLVVEQSREK